MVSLLENWQNSVINNQNKGAEKVSQICREAEDLNLVGFEMTRAIIGFNQ